MLRIPALKVRGPPCTIDNTNLEISRSYQMRSCSSLLPSLRYRRSTLARRAPERSNTSFGGCHYPTEQRARRLRFYGSSSRVANRAIAGLGEGTAPLSPRPTLPVVSAASTDGNARLHCPVAARQCAQACELAVERPGLHQRDYQCVECYALVLGEPRTIMNNGCAAKISTMPLTTATAKYAFPATVGAAARRDHRHRGHHQYAIGIYPTCGLVKRVGWGYPLVQARCGKRTDSANILLAPGLC
jgi:hypothetical protein